MEWFSDYWDKFWVNWNQSWMLAFNVIGAVLMDIAEVVTDVFIGIFSMLLDLVLAIVNGLGQLPGAAEFAGMMATIPPEWFILTDRLHIPQASGIFLAAVIVRFVLQLIPFVRLGS